MRKPEEGSFGNSFYYKKNQKLRICLNKAVFLKYLNEIEDENLSPKDKKNGDDT